MFMVSNQTIIISSTNVWNQMSFERQNKIFSEECYLVTRVEFAWVTRFSIMWQALQMKLSWNKDILWILNSGLQNCANYFLKKWRSLQWLSFENYKLMLLLKTNIFKMHKKQPTETYEKKHSRNVFESQN